MTDTPPKPKRRRWRWLLVVVAIAVVTTWALWPTGIDPRFVGTWSVGVPGTATTYFPNGHWERESLRYSNLRWRVRSGRLYLYLADENPIIRFKDQLWLAYLKLTRQSYNEWKHEFEIVDVSSDAFVLRDDSLKLQRWRRVPYEPPRPDATSSFPGLPPGVR